MLLTRSANLPEETATELARLRPERIVVVGGVDSVSTAVAAQLAPYATSGQVVRVAGNDHYATSVAISQLYPAKVATAYLASGEVFPDALAGAALAGHQGVPLLLTSKTELPSATRAELERLAPQQIIVLGGPGALSDAVLQTAAPFSSSPIRRIAGTNRYRTAAAVAAEIKPPASTTYVATGQNYPDALAGAAAAARDGAPLLLTPSDRVHPATAQALDSQGPQVLYALGGNTVIHPSTVQSLAEYLVSPRPPQSVTPSPAGELFDGNFLGYGIDPFHAYTGMWGHHVADDLKAESTMRVLPSTFPEGTVFTWDVTPDPGWGGVNGYLHTSYGNYDDSPNSIKPLQVDDIAELTVDIGWTMSGSEDSGLLVECWLSPTATPSGPVPREYEVGWFPRLSPSGKRWVQTLPAVGSGSFTDTNGVKWLVVESLSASNEPYFIAYRPGHADFQGELEYHTYFAFLRSAGKIPGDVWHNGSAFGVEPHKGAGSLTITKFEPTYTEGTRPPRPSSASAPRELISNGTFDSDANWSGAWYSGKTISDGTATFTDSPAYDGFSQPVTLEAGKYYELTWSLLRYKSGNVYPRLTGGTQTAGTVRSTDGTYTEWLQAGAGNTLLDFQMETGGSLSIDDVSLIGPYDTIPVEGR